MNDRTVRQKVICYVVRDAELLAFLHLDEPWDESGLQVPAGSIEPGESPEGAALREAREETGLDSLRLVRKLGETEYDLSPYRDEVQHRHVFQLTVDEETPGRWVSHENDPGDGSDVTRFECFWIPLAPSADSTTQSVFTKTSGTFRPPPRQHPSRMCRGAECSSSEHSERSESSDPTQATPVPSRP